MRLPGVELLRPIGRGGMGTVWEGRLVGSDRVVAVKVLTAKAMRRPEYRDALEAEALAVAALDHPSIVRLLDFGRVPEDAGGPELVPGSPYLVLERAQGSLRTTMQHVPSWTAVRGILLSLLDALGHAHARGFVHRDLKPENVLVFDGRTKLADFGIAWSFEKEPGGEPTSAGSPQYMAPEQIMRQVRMGPWTDLYALGCLGWWLVAGRTPFAGAASVLHAQVHDEPPPLVPLQPVPDGFEAWLRALLVKDTQRRAAWAADAVWALLDLGSAPDPEPGLPFGVGAPAAATVTHVEPEWTGTAPATVPGPAALAPAPVPSSWRPPQEPAWRGATVGGAFWLARPPLFGRVPERDRLWDALRGVAQTGRPRVLVIRGQRGSGKTHMAEWFTGRAAELGAANVLRVVFTPGGTRPGATGVLAPWFARHFPTEHAMFGALRESAAPHLAEPDSLAQRMVGLVFPTGAEPVRELQPAERLAVINGLLATLGAERPVLILMDDVHWAPSGLDFFRAVLQVGARPILMVATVGAGHPEADARVEALRARPDADVVDLSARPEPEALVEALTPVVGAYAGPLVAWADASPSLAVQVIGLWADEGVFDDGGTLGRTPRLPADLADLWARRLATVGDPADRRALAIAARLGPDVDPAAWRGACASEGLHVADDLLHRFTRRGFLEMRRRDGHFVFVHPSLAESLR